MPDTPQRRTSPRRTSPAAVTGRRPSGPAIDRLGRQHQAGFVELVRQLQRELGQLPRELGNQVTRRLPSV